MTQQTFYLKMCKMKSFLCLIFLQISRVIMDNLEDLRIIDSLLKDYDRRATPTNRMGRFYCLDGFVDFVTLSIQTPEFWITNLIEPPFVLWRNSLDNFENRTTVLWISLLEHKLNKKINIKLNRTDYNLKCIVVSFLLNIQ